MIRTRFAPSPTGSLHVGGARTALFNYLFARKMGGKFVLRIEDTNIARSTKESEQLIMRDLKWLGIEWDEGPDKPGDFGPYRQTERLDKYQEALKKLQRTPGSVYPCFCAEEDLEAKRKVSLCKGEKSAYSLIYNCDCRNRSQEEIEKLKKEQYTYAWRFRVLYPAKGSTVSRDKILNCEYEPIVVKDLIHGDITFNKILIEDFIIMKSNGIPSYNFACVVDDASMKISHVIRGDEHLTNTPRQILLYEALGIDPPQFAHLSMILAPDRTKLAKRHGTTAVREFKEKGYLPHSLINYISLLGWSPKDNMEIFAAEKEENADVLLDLLLQKLTIIFSLEGVSKNPAIFDQPKLTWMNSQYIKRILPKNLLEAVSEISTQTQSEIMDDKIRNAYLSVIQTEKDRFNTLLQIEEHFKEYFDSNKFILKESEIEESSKEVLNWSWSLEVLKQFKKEIENSEKLSDEMISGLMKNLQKNTDKKGKDLYWPIRIAITGKTHGPELVHLLPLLGKEEILKRIENFLFFLEKK